MDVATAKPSAEERARLPHHLIDMVWPDEPYTLAQYQRDATAAIADIHARGGLPLLVGGTGLYVRAVVDGLAIPEVAPQPELRAELEAEAVAQGPGALHARLAALDPVTAARIDPNNVRRLVRAIEVCRVTGQPFSAQQGARPTPYRPVLLGMTMERGALYARADARIDAMLAAGLVEETRGLVERGYGWGLPSMSSLGYREIGNYLRGEMALDEAITRFKVATHAYIRRQLTVPARPADYLARRGATDRSAGRRGAAAHPHGDDRGMSRHYWTDSAPRERLGLMRGEGRVIEGDQPGAATEGDVGPGPLGDHEQAIAEVDQVEDVDAGPDQPAQ